MRVLFLTTEFIPLWGGIGTYAYEITKNFPKDCEVLVVTPFRSWSGNYQPPTELIAEQIPPNIKILHLSYAKDTFFYNLRFQLACARSLHKIIADFQPDIIHSQSSMPDFFLNNREFSGPIVTTVHTTIHSQIDALKTAEIEFSYIGVSERLTFAFDPFLRFLERIYYHRRNHFITVSRYYAGLLHRNFGIDSTNIKVIYNGVDAEVYNRSKAGEARNYFPDIVQEDVPKILFLSRLTGIKGFDIFLKSIPLILSRVDAEFIIAGTGHLKLTDQDILNKYPNYIRYLGYVPHSLKPYLYSICDVFVLPSYHENCPLSLLEAMASELAIIATRVGGIPEIVKNREDGILIANDPSALADAVVTLIEDSNYMRYLGQMARRKVKRSFSWKDAAMRTLAYYEEVIKH